MNGSYEEAIEELKGIVRKMEDGSASLDESIRLYEKGAELIRRCEKLLEEAEVKVTLLREDASP